MLAKIKKGIRYVFRKIFQPTEVTIRGDIVSFPKNISSGLRNALYSERFESEEVDSMRKTINSTDVVLDLGASIGCVTLAACHIVGSENVTSIEANPKLADYAFSNFKKNNVNPDYKIGLASNKDGEAEFKISEDFWSSSVLTENNMTDEIINVDQIDCNKLIQDKKINSIICDIEGYESILLPQLDLTPIKNIIIELHPSVYGDAEVSKIIVYLLNNSFHFRPYKSHGNVYVFNK